MTDTTNAPDPEFIINQIVGIAANLRGVRAAVARWGDADLWTARDELERFATDDPDARDARNLLCDLLDRANAERMARNAPWIAVDVTRDKGRWTLCAWHDRGEALRREYGDFETARAAGEALFTFLGLQGRAGEFSYESPPRHGPAPADLDTKNPF